jgi:hypothetical protein
MEYSKEFPTYKNGSKTIDKNFGTPKVLEFISQVGHIKFNKCFDYDHRDIL